jgi:Leucine-rich repeat (LRR) protein
VRFLTAAEELSFFGNANTFLLDLDEGESIGYLAENLKRLTIGAYGLSSLGNNITKLKNLEFLDIGSNNFQSIPDVLTKENFPKLRTLIMNACQRSYITDLSNNIKKNLGGFMDEEEFPIDLIKWDLDTLVLSVNYLHGTLPTFEDDPEIPVYTQEDIANSKNKKGVDTLPQILVDRKIKKVMPSTKRFSINLNRLNGELPEWLLYHPALDLWYPFSLVFPQEGRWSDGSYAGFSNAPSNLNYYYEHYVNKENLYIESDEDVENAYIFNK